VLPVAFSLLVCQLLLAFALIPPWQQPDEPTHLARAEFQKNRLLAASGYGHPAREDEILISMARYDFWVHRGMVTPATIPKNFEASGQYVAVPVLTVERPPAFSLVTGRVLSWLPRLTLIEDLYAMRVLSAALAILTLFVAWLTAHRTLAPSAAAMIACLLALHPQFAIISAAATPDAMVNLLGACVWWQAACGVADRRVLLALALMWTAAVAAAAVDRMGVPLVAVASIVSLVATVRRASLRRPWMMFGTSTAVFVILALAALVAALAAFGGSYALGHVFAGGWAPVPGAITWDRFVRFTWRLHEGWWYALGWGRYPPPVWWSAISAALTLAAVVGVGRRLFGDAILDRRTRTLLVLAAISIAIQLAAVYWTFFRMGRGAQGRYLFPFLVPSLILLWVGIEAWVPRSRRMYAAAALIFLFALLDAAGWILVVIPAYYASL